MDVMAGVFRIHKVLYDNDVVWRTKKLSLTATEGRHQAVGKFPDRIMELALSRLVENRTLLIGPGGYTGCIERRGNIIVFKPDDTEVSSSWTTRSARRTRTPSGPPR